MDHAPEARQCRRDRPARRARRRRLPPATEADERSPRRCHGKNTTATTGRSSATAIGLKSPGQSHDVNMRGDTGSSSVPSTTASSADRAARANRARHSPGGHQPGVEVASRQTRDLSHGLGGRRTRSCAKMLNSPAALGQPGQHRQRRQRRFRTARGSRQSQTRKFDHTPTIVFAHSYATLPTNPLCCPAALY